MTSDDQTLVSVVTPTFPGRETELKRCVRSVRNLDWPCIQHVIVSDRNPRLASQYAHASRFATRCRDVVIVEINETWRNETTNASTGSYPWMIGSRLALGQFVAFLGDDDELLPHHVRRHVKAMRDAEAMFSVSQVDFRVGGEPYCVIGSPDWRTLGSVDSTGIMCSADALQYGIWDANGVNAGDWQMVNAWLDAGLRGIFIEEITGVHHDGWAAGKSGRPEDKPE